MPLDDPKLQEILDGIFAETPASSLDIYLTSSLMEVRRAMHGDSLRVREATILEAPELPAWLNPFAPLPPWEARLLSEVFTSRPVVVIQGGSGCGKSSARYFLTNHCRRLIQNTESPYFPYLMVVVDLQDQPEKFKLKHHDETKRLEQIEEFLLEFSETLDIELERVISPEILREIFVDAFLEPRSSDDVITRVEKVRLKIRRKFREQFPDEAINWGRVLKMFADLGNGHDQTIARFLLLLALGRQIWIKDTRPFSLLIDNIDPFPEYLQQALIRTFEAISHTERVEPRFEHMFSIVVFARLSTSTRHSGAMDGVAAKRVSFHAPDVSDLVFYRLTAFMLSPVAIRPWNELKPGLQEILLARMWRLWARLVDEEGGFSRLLSGLAGTNGRIAFKLAKVWLLSPRLPEKLSPPETRDLAFLEEAVGVVVLGKMAGAFSRWLQMLPEIDSEPAAWLERGIRTLLTDYCIIGLPNNFEEKRDIRRVVSEVARRALREVLEKQADQNFLANAARQPILKAAEVVFANLRMQEGFERASFNPLLARVASNLDAFYHRFDKENSALATLITEWLINALLATGSDLNRSSSIGELLVNQIEEIIHGPSQLGRRRKGSGLRPNRWEANSILVSPETIDRRTSRSAINIFSADGMTLAPVALNVLAVLDETERGVHALALRKRLEEWGYSETSIISALTDMVHPDRRLIYSAVKDMRDGVATWFQDSSTVVHISAAGTGYLTAVGVEPAYLQWALLEPERIRRELGGENEVERELGWAIGRLRLVLEGFKIVRRDEVERVRRIENRLEQDEHEYQSPVARIALDGMGRFIHDIAGQKRAHLQRATTLAVQFIEFGTEILREHTRLFGGIPPRWEEKWAFAENDCRRLFSIEEMPDPYP